MTEFETTAEERSSWLRDAQPYGSPKTWYLGRLLRDFDRQAARSAELEAALQHAAAFLKSWDGGFGPDPDNSWKYDEMEAEYAAILAAILARPVTNDGRADLLPLHSVLELQLKARIAELEAERDRSVREIDEFSLRMVDGIVTLKARITELEAALRAAVLAEREACATVALEQRCEHGTPWDVACLAIAAAIRGRTTP